MDFLKSCVFFFLVPFVSFSQNETLYKRMSQATVGKFLYDKNIKIINDSVDIYIKVNLKGYCHSVDFVSNSKTKFTLNTKTIISKVDQQLNWIYNDSIVDLCLQYEEYQSCGDYFSNRGRNHRYYNYAGHGYSNDLLYIITNSDYGYGIFVEPESDDFLTLNTNNQNSGKGYVEEWLVFSSLEEGFQFLNSNEVVEKGRELQEIQDKAILKENEMKSMPIDLFELPYKFHFGMTEFEVEKQLKFMFGSFTKDIVDSYQFKNVKERKIFKDILYSVVENEVILRIQIWYFENKIIRIGYSHWNKNHSRIDDLDLKIKEKLSLIRNENYLLFDIFLSESGIEGNHLIWSIEELERLKGEEDFLVAEKNKDKKDLENRIGNKM